MKKIIKKILKVCFLILEIPLALYNTAVLLVLIAEDLTGLGFLFDKFLLLFGIENANFLTIILFTFPTLILLGVLVFIHVDFLCDKNNKNTEQVKNKETDEILTLNQNTTPILSEKLILMGGFFKTSSVLSSILFLPGVVTEWVFVFQGSHPLAAIITTITYAVVLLVCFLLSKSKASYMICKEDCIEIQCRKKQINLDKSDVVKIEYYKMFSYRWIISTFLEISGPCTSYITYIKEGEKFCESLECPKIKKLRKFCKEANITLVER